MGLACTLLAEHQPKTANLSYSRFSRRGSVRRIPGNSAARAQSPPRHNVRSRKPMRNSKWCCTLVVMAALSVALFSTGCRSGGWGMPGSSWVSWGKKKPPTSSIAGTREVPKPPSVSVPPYPSGDTSSTSSIAGMSNGNPSASTGHAPRIRMPWALRRPPDMVSSRLREPKVMPLVPTLPEGEQ